METFTEAELLDAARRLGSLGALVPVLKSVRAQRQLEKTPVAGEDDVITARELKEALWRERQVAFSLNNRAFSDDLADRIFKHAAASREPEYPPGTVVRSARGTFYQRTHYEKWLMFGIGHSVSHDRPERPLEVM